MDFSGVEDDVQLAACEFGQDVAVAVLAVRTPGDEPAARNAGSATTSMRSRPPAFSACPPSTVEGKLR